MNGTEFDFSVMFDGDIEDIVRWDDTDLPRELYEEVVEKLINTKRIIVGERTEGHIIIENDMVKIDYRWCSRVGEDWNNDVWEDENVLIPLTELN